MRPIGIRKCTGAPAVGRSVYIFRDGRDYDGGLIVWRNLQSDLWCYENRIIQLKRKLPTIEEP